MYPGANALEFLSLVQIIVECLLQWDQENHKSKGTGIFGQTDTYGSAFEEQGKETLHMHMMIWVKNYNLFFNFFLKDGTIDETMRASLLHYVNMVMCSSYELWSDDIIKHDMIQGNDDSKCSGTVTEVDPQTIRDSRSKDLSHDIKGKLLICSDCGKKFHTKTLIHSFI